MKISTRTKNRLNEHKLLSPRDTMVSPSFAKDGREWTLFDCKDKNCDWQGWLPNEEIAGKIL